MNWLIIYLTNGAAMAVYLYFSPVTEQALFSARQYNPKAELIHIQIAVAIVGLVFWPVFLLLIIFKIFLKLFA